MECTKCRRLLPASEFHKDRRSVNGLHCHCKECKRRYDRELRQRRKRANANRTHPSDQNLQCPGCKRLLLAVDFSRNPTRLSGLEGWCKTCMNKNVKRFRQRCAAANEAKRPLAVFIEPEDGELEEALALSTTSEMNEALSRFGLKWCPACRQAKVYSDYNKNKCDKWGRQTYCRKCQAKGPWRDFACAYAP